MLKQIALGGCSRLKINEGTAESQIMASVTCGLNIAEMRLNCSSDTFVVDVTRRGAEAASSKTRGRRLHLDISFVRWHRRYYRDKYFANVSLLQLSRWNVFELEECLSSLTSSSWQNLVSAALEHYTETLELRAEKISTWRFYTRKQKKARGRRQRPDAIIRRWYLRKTLEEIYEVAMQLGDGTLHFHLVNLTCAYSIRKLAQCYR